TDSSATDTLGPDVSTNGGSNAWKTSDSRSPSRTKSCTTQAPGAPWDTTTPSNRRVYEEGFPTSGVASNVTSLWTATARMDPGWAPRSTGREAPTERSVTLPVWVPGNCSNCNRSMRAQGRKDGSSTATRG